MIDKVALGNRITEYRRQKDITVQELVEATGISKSYIMNICSGRGAIPTLDILQRLSKCLDTSIDMLLIDSLNVYKGIDAKTKIDNDMLQYFYSMDLESKEFILQYMRDFKIYKTVQAEQTSEIEEDAEYESTGYVSDILGELKDITQDKQYEFLSIIKSMKKLSEK